MAGATTKDRTTARATRGASTTDTTPADATTAATDTTTTARITRSSPRYKEVCSSAKSAEVAPVTPPRYAATCKASNIASVVTPSAAKVASPRFVGICKALKGNLDNTKVTGGSSRYQSVCKGLNHSLAPTRYRAICTGMQPSHAGGSHYDVSSRYSAICRGLTTTTTTRQASVMTVDLNPEYHGWVNIRPALHDGCTLLKAITEIRSNVVQQKKHRTCFKGEITEILTVFVSQHYNIVTATHFPTKYTYTLCKHG